MVWSAWSGRSFECFPTDRQGRTRWSASRRVTRRTKRISSVARRVFVVALAPDCKCICIRSNCPRAVPRMHLSQWPPLPLPASLQARSSTSSNDRLPSPNEELPLPRPSFRLPVHRFDVSNSFSSYSLSSLTTRQHLLTLFAALQIERFAGFSNRTFRHRLSGLDFCFPFSIICVFHLIDTRSSTNCNFKRRQTNRNLINY
jgi:hypothetical protein